MTTYLKCKIDNKLQNGTQFEDLPKIPVAGNIFFKENILPVDDQVFIEIEGIAYQKDLIIIEGDTLFYIIRKLWRQAEDVVLSESATICNRNITMYKNITLAEVMRHKLMDFIELFKSSMIRLKELEDCTINKLTSTSIVIDNEPISHYFHLYLAINLLILSIESECDVELNKIGLFIESIMKDLIVLSYKVYQKNISINLLQSQPFPCVCVKNFWWFLICFSRKYDKDMFWKLYSTSFEIKDEEFFLWMLYHMAILEGYDDQGIYIGFPLTKLSENISFEKHLRSLIASNCEKKILNILKIIDPLLTSLWINSTKLEPYQILWEYYYKNLNNPTMNEVKIPKTPKEFIDIIDHLKINSKSVCDSYEYFISMLYKHFTVHPQQWPKLRGRIYSRLPPHKMNTYNDKAIFHITLLFLMLTCVNDEMIEKLRSLLDNLPKERQNSEIIWIIYITMMIVGIREKEDVTKLSKTLQILLQEASECRDQYHLIKHYINGLDMIISSNDSFNLSQSLLNGSWITNYINSCPYIELCSLLNTLTWIIENTENNSNWEYITSAYSSNILQGLKEVAVSNTAPPQIGKLAMLICCNSPHMSPSIIEYFCGDSINVKVTNQFLCSLMNNCATFTLTMKPHEITIIQGWVRCCLLNLDFNSEELTKNIFKLEMIKSVVHINEENINNPLPAFMKALNREMVMHRNTHRLKELCENSFGHIDHWLGSYLTPTTSDAYTLNIYTNMSLLFYNCSPLLYHKSKSTCLLNRLLTILLLPTEVLMGRSPPVNILRSIERTWHLFLQGIFTIDYSTDPYIERTLKDLIIRYLPHFSVSNSPITRIFNDDHLATFVLDKISNTFLIRVARSSEENSFKAVKTMHHVLELSHDITKIKMILHKILIGIFEIIMFNSQKAVAIDFIKFVASSEWYCQVREELQLAIQNVTEKQLAFNANNYYQLIGMLIKIIPNEIRNCLPHIKKHIITVERMRGVGFDNTLRQGLNKIENSLSVI